MPDRQNNFLKKNLHTVYRIFKQSLIKKRLDSFSFVQTAAECVCSFLNDQLVKVQLAQYATRINGLQ